MSGRERAAARVRLSRRLPRGGQQGQLGRVDPRHDRALSEWDTGVHWTGEHVHVRSKSRRRLESAHDRLRKL